MIGSTDIVGHKLARPFPLYSEWYYRAESDFFSFHAIQLNAKNVLSANKPLTGLISGPLTAQFYLLFLIEPLASRYQFLKTPFSVKCG